MFRRLLAGLRCPHHADLCQGRRTCCCADRHWRPVKTWLETR